MFGMCVRGQSLHGAHMCWATFAGHLWTYRMKALPKVPFVVRWTSKRDIDLHDLPAAVVLHRLLMYQYDS